MKIVLIKFGLGNQMFEYAFALALKKRCRLERVYIDSHYYGTYECHNGYELDKIFDLEIPEAGKQRIKLLTRYYIRYSNWLKYRKKGSRRWTECFEPRYGVYLPNAGKRCFCYYDGYWQTSRYFADCRKEILKAFTFRPFQDEENRAIASSMGAANSVVVHVRRGDYVGRPQYENICTEEYYRQAFALMRERLGRMDVYVISNDLEWCRTHIPPMLEDDSITYIDHNTGTESYRDMQLMTYARGLIIANSSFSWWGAYLNQREDKIVVAPKVWFNREGIEPPQEPDWILL